MSPSSARSRIGRSAGLPALCAVAIVAACGSASATEHRAPPGLQAAPVGVASLAELEHAFWVCDYLATTRRASEVLIDICTDAYDELKERRFGGDFDALLLWWQQNRRVRHAELQETEGAPR